MHMDAAIMMDMQTSVLVAPNLVFSMIYIQYISHYTNTTRTHTHTPHHYTHTTHTNRVRQDGKTRYEVIILQYGIYTHSHTLHIHTTQTQTHTFTGTPTQIHATPVTATRQSPQ